VRIDASRDERRAPDERVGAGARDGGQAHVPACNGPQEAKRRERAADEDEQRADRSGAEKCCERGGPRSQRNGAEEEQAGRQQLAHSQCHRQERPEEPAHAVTLDG